MILKSRAKRRITAGRHFSYLKVLLFSILVGLSPRVNAQPDSCNLRVSLLTCGPGSELYSVFGHSALRVTDKTSNTDVIYNYGTFDFEDPDFYAKFVRGKLLYYVSVEQFDQFMYAYQMENRYVIEQLLNLSCSEKHRLSQALQINSLEQNKYYQYEFLFDNCSTRLRDIVAANNDDSVRFKRIIPTPAPTFRHMLHDYLFAGNQYWSAFGIDLLLASRIDRKVQNEESMFLPDYLMKGFDSSQVQMSSLVQSKQLILPSREINGDGFAIRPIFVTSFLLLIGIVISIKPARFDTFATYFDGIFFFALGFAGCLMLFMWYGTDHELCRDNYNLYWAIPSHIVMAFLASRNTSFVRKYFSLSAIIAIVFVLCWPFLPQGMNSAFFPLVLLSAIRSFRRATQKPANA
jgi:hypothetical protein